MRSAFLLALAAAILATGSGGPVAAQGQCSFCDTNPPPSGGGGGGRPNNRALDLEIQSDIDFGRLLIIGSGDGRVILDLVTGSKTVFGDLDDFGGLTVQGRATIRGRPMRTIRIGFPSSVTLSDARGGRAELRDFKTSLRAMPTLDANGQLEFTYTGTLYTTAAIASGGTLRGRIPIQVDYD